MTTTQVSPTHGSQSSGRPRAWRYIGLGSLRGLVWAAGRHCFMAQVAGTGSEVEWAGTFGWSLAPGVATGALLGLAAWLSLDRRTPGLAVAGRQPLGVRSAIPQRPAAPRPADLSSIPLWAFTVSSKLWAGPLAGQRQVSALVCSVRDVLHDVHVLRGGLSDRERDVLGLMAEGLTNGGIADRLSLSPRTVEVHVSHLLTKLDIDESDTAHRRVLAVLSNLNSDTSP